MEIPKKYKDLVGTKKFFHGGIFSSKMAMEQTEFDVLDIRCGDAVIVDLKNTKYKHPTFELLIRRKGMRAARWTRPFPIREINI